MITGTHRLGRRGLSLLFFGTLDVIYAISLFTPDRATKAGAMFVWLASVAPLWTWGLLWAVTAVACYTFAFQIKDRIGFTFAIFLKVLWGLLGLGGWLFAGVDRGYVAAAIWLAAAGFVWVISSWAEPDEGRSAWTPPSR